MGKRLLLFTAVFVALGVWLPAQCRADALPEAAREAFVSLYRSTTGCTPAAELAAFAVDPGLSKSGNDAYRIVSTETGVRIVGSNARALQYAVYDLFARRAGCRYFWDGDILPRVGKLDLSGLDIREEARFKYRGFRYFAHRGLTRFQCEHWGFEDWKREIDWLVKTRQNIFFFRVGNDDLFPKAFPEACRYPDASKPLPSQGEGYDNRSLFWSLEYRGELRKRVLAYARTKGLLYPEDFGTITHWYTRTPQDFLDNMKPDFLPQATKVYSEPTGLLWDVRQDKWMDAYWKLTEVSIRDYGSSEILHTQGFSERRCYESREANMKLKTAMNAKMIGKAASVYPNAPIIFSCWDFWHNWKADEVRSYLKSFDPKRIVLLDFCLNAPDRGADDCAIWNWDVAGRLPYMIGPFRSEPQNMIHEDYDLIWKRFAKFADDPYCVGFIDWTENAHPDALQIRHQTENSWKLRPNETMKLVDELSRDRYGSQAERMAAIWKRVVPLASKVKGEFGIWSWNYGQAIGFWLADPKNVQNNLRANWNGFGLAAFSEVPAILRELSEVHWTDEFVKRDAMDLARAAGDRLTVEVLTEAVAAYLDWKSGKGTSSDVERKLVSVVPLVRMMERLLQLHGDYSIAETFDHMEKIEHIRNPEFDRILVDNASCWYCVSHQAENARYFLTPAAEALVAQMRANLAKGDRAAKLDSAPLLAVRQKMLATRLEAMRPTDPRTEAAWKRTLLDFAEAAESANVSFDEGRLLVERLPSKALVVEDNLAWLKAGRIPSYAVTNVVRWLELKGCDISAYRAAHAVGDPVEGPLRKDFRIGYMLDISHDKVPRQEMLKTIVDILSAAGFNEFQLYLDHAFAYKGHEKVWKDCSPVTAEEVRELDEYAWARGVRLVPNQNSLGHLAKWLCHADYRDAFAEAPNGYDIEHPRLKSKAPASLCPTNPKTLEFLAGLYDQLLPNFCHATEINVGCDETWDLFDKRGRSAAVAAKIGVPNVYANHLINLHRILKTRGRRMAFWADMVLRYPEILDRVPKDAHTLQWGYYSEWDGAGCSCEFEGRCLALANRGIPFSVCPSTSTYKGQFFDLDRASANIRLCVSSARKFGAEGLLLTEWGTGGHPSAFLSSVPQIVEAGLLCRGLPAQLSDIAAGIDAIVRVPIGADLMTFWSTRTGPKDRYDWVAMRAALDRMLKVSAAAPGWVKNGLAMLDHHLRVQELRNAGKPLPAGIKDEYRRLWLEANRPGGLESSARQRRYDR
ncbi:MAG: family 20 glycosylhydrolase [Kiritimatiellae bacterium]|nr:family 20 glycosylhydrolase [Kiritimatiellia bacterium]